MINESRKFQMESYDNILEKSGIPFEKVLCESKIIKLLFLRHPQIVE